MKYFCKFCYIKFNIFFIYVKKKIHVPIGPWKNYKKIIWLGLARLGSNIVMIVYDPLWGFLSLENMPHSEMLLLRFIWIDSFIWRALQAGLLLLSTSSSGSRGPSRLSSTTIAKAAVTRTEDGGRGLSRQVTVVSLGSRKRLVVDSHHAWQHSVRRKRLCYSLV